MAKIGCFGSLLCLGASSFLLSATAVAAVPVTRAVKIMPMGDSITTGLCDGRGTSTCTPAITNTCTDDPVTLNPDASGYRPYLKQALNHMGMNSDFVGSQVHPKSGPSYPNNHFSDPQHEGHGGWFISQATACTGTATGKWFATNMPDVILLHIGTNDALYCTSPTVMRDDLATLVNSIYAYLPANTKVIIAKIIPIGNGGVNPIANCASKAPYDTPERVVVAFNQLIPALAAAQQQLGRSVSVVDMHAKLTDADFYIDKVHPNTSGYKKMASAWAAAIYATGAQTETVTAYGKMWNFDKNGTYLGQTALAAIPRYNTNICAGNPAPCKFDTRALFTAGGAQYESITAYGKYWNFDMMGSLVGQGQLTSVARYNTYICAGQPSPCKFDTRTFQTFSDPTGDMTIESITAYGKYWNFDSSGNLLGQGTLPSVARYNSYICSGRPSPCTFDTRTVVTAVGDLQVESIIGYGNYWNFNLDGSFSSQGSLTSVPKYTSYVCAGQASPCRFDTRMHQATQ